MTTYVLPAILAQRRGDVARKKPSLQQEGFNDSSWSKLSDPDVDQLRAHHGAALTRQDLFDLGTAARAAQGTISDRRRLFFATLMWGYGDRGGRGPLNAQRALQSGHLDRILGDACDALARHDLAGGWDAFWRSRLHGYDWPFFTKYLYFAARTDPGWTVRPVILDSQVESALSFLGRWLGAQLPPRRRRRRDRFVDYCTVMAEWSEQLGVDVDQLELYLFEHPSDVFFDPALALRPLAVASVGDVRAGTASLNLTSVVQDLPQALLESI
jgi:hypothetical protein